MIGEKKMAHRQGAKLDFRATPPAVKNVIQIARLEKFLQNDDMPETKSLQSRSPTWRDVFSLPDALAPVEERPAHSAEASISRIFGPPADTILPPPVTNAALAT